MKREDLTDAHLLKLHLQGMTAAGRRPETITARRGALRRLADYLDAESENPRALIDATSDELAEWQADHAYLAAKSMTEYVGHIRLFYEWLIRPMRVLEESPAAWLTKPIVRRRRPRPIPEPDLEFALQTAVVPRQRAWLMLGAYAGLRSVDIAGLDRDDILTDGEYPMLRVRGKGDNEDIMVIGYELLAELEPFMHSGGRGALFVRDDGRRVSVRQVRVEMNGFLHSIGLSYTFHQLRHRYGTQLFKITKDIRHTQRQMRHASVLSTEIYVDIGSEQDGVAVEALDLDLARRRRRKRA